MYSQLKQDDIVFSLLNQQKNGTYVDVGSGDWKDANNTLFLEEQGWTGINIDYDKRFQDGWEKHRSESKVYFEDATTFDYKSLFQERNYPKQIDYLSLDIDPSDATLAALKKLPLDEYRFSVITYETEVYRAGIDGYYDEIWQKKSAEIFESYGYELVIKNVANMGNPYEDWWVDPKVVDRAIIDKFSKTDSWSRESTECIFSNTQFSIMPITAILEE